MAKRPEHSKKKSLATAAPLWEQTARRLASVFARKYRIQIDGVEAQLTSVTFSAWAAREAEGRSCQISLFRIEGLKSPALFLISQGSGAVICDLLLGGRAGQKGEPAQKQDFSHATISKRIETRFVKVLAAQLEEELAGWGAGAFRYFSSETDVRFYNQIGPDILCQAIRFRFLTPGSDPVEVQMVVPQAALARLEQKAVPDEDDQSPAQMLVSYKHLENLEVDLAFSLSEISMTLKELVELTPGALLAVDPSQAVLRVEGKLFKPGTLTTDDQDQWVFKIG